MDARIQIVAIATSAALLLLVLEFVRQKRFLERYALLWLLSASVLLGLSVWRGALQEFASLVGISYPPNALFLIAFGFALVLLLHFSIATSRLSDQTKILAQRLALAEERIRRTEQQGAAHTQTDADVPRNESVDQDADRAERLAAVEHRGSS